MTVIEQIKQELFELIQKHDYSHMFSDDDRAWRSGMNSEKLIKEKYMDCVQISEKMLFSC